MLSFFYDMASTYSYPAAMRIERLAADIARLDVLGILHECEVACVSARDGVDVAAAHRQRSRPSSVCLSLKQGAEQNVTHIV